jgi:putative transposase
MARRIYTPKRIINKLREAEVLLSQGSTVGEAARKIGITASLFRKKLSWLAKACWKEDIVWSPGYFVSTVGIGEREILKYVKWQQSRDSDQAKLKFF